MNRRFVLGRKRVNRGEAVVASKDQIQQLEVNLKVVDAFGQRRNE